LLIYNIISNWYIIDINNRYSNKGDIKKNLIFNIDKEYKHNNEILNF